MNQNKESRFEGYHYRTSSRFGNRVEISIDEKTFSITGARIGVGIYKTWILIQAILLFLIIPAIIFPIIFGAPIYLFIILALLFLHYVISAVGAVALYELANFLAFTKNKKGGNETFKVADIKDIRIGKGWERNGLWFVIPYVIPMINMVIEGMCVSFEAPDNVTGKDVVYAFHMHSKEETKNLVDLLK
jgi:hypothetical protein